MVRGPNSLLVSFVLTQLGVTTADLIFLMTLFYSSLLGCYCPRLGASLLGKQEPLGISDRQDLVQGMVTEVCAGLEEPKGETCYPKIWNEESCCCPRSGKANQGRESSPGPQAGSVSGGPVLLSSLWWGPEPAATRSSSICLALSQSGSGRGFALPPAF